MYHYTYLTQHINGKYYVGRHSTNNLNDEYFGSGKWVRSLKDKTNLTKTILSYYDSETELLNAETLLIQEHINNELNMNFNHSPVGFSSGHLNPSKTEARKKDISERMKGSNNPMKKGHSKESKEKIRMSLTGENNPMYGKNHTNEAKDKVSKANTGRVFSKETRKLWSEQRKGKDTWNKGTKGLFSIGQDGKEKISNSWKNRNKLLCQHCDKEFMPNTYKRWHGENCKTILKDHG